MSFFVYVKTLILRNNKDLKVRKISEKYDIDMNN